MENNNFYDTRDEQVKRIVNRSRLFLWIWEGIKKSVLPPWIGLVPVVILVDLLYFIYNNRCLPYDKYFPEEMYFIYDDIKILGIILIMGILLIGLLYLIGMPLHAKSDEIDLMMAFKLKAKDYVKIPILISRKRMKNGVLRREFYSRWIEKKEWEEKRTAIEDSLKCKIEAIEYGGNKGRNTRRIAVFSTDLNKYRERKVFKDPLFSDKRNKI